MIFQRLYFSDQNPSNVLHFFLNCFDVVIAKYARAAFKCYRCNVFFTISLLLFPILGFPLNSRERASAAIASSPAQLESGRSGGETERGESSRRPTESASPKSPASRGRGWILERRVGRRCRRWRSGGESRVDAAAPAQLLYIDRPAVETAGGGGGGRRDDAEVELLWRRCADQVSHKADRARRRARSNLPNVGRRTFAEKKMNAVGRDPAASRISLERG